MSKPKPVHRSEGDTVPEVRLRLLVDDRWTTVDTNDLFANQTVVLFALPGAYTPTCSSNHLPRYNELAPLLRNAGVDRIVCLSMNDPFVMAQWGKDQQATNVMLLPDGNGAFTEQMGMLVDKGDLNFGKRSRRYSMLVRDRRIEKIFVESDAPDDPLEVSDADTMLDLIAPSTKRPDRVALLTREGCPYCATAKALLTEAGLAYAEIALPSTVRGMALGAIANADTVPQVFINGRLIGDSEALADHLRAAASSEGIAAVERSKA